MSRASPTEGAGTRMVAWLSRHAVLVALLGMVAIFSANLTGILVNNFALPAIVSIAMTLVVSAGGIDLSVGTAVDVASLTLVSLVLAGQSVWIAVFAALAGGLRRGMFQRRFDRLPWHPRLSSPRSAPCSSAAACSNC